jgi:Holliday junction DNA helicase RuvB
LLEIDEAGLNGQDRKYIKLLATKFHNSPVGIETIASSLSEDQHTVEDFIEPYLLQLGFLKKTPRGRVLTPQAFKHLNLPYKQNDVEQEKLV